MQIYLVGGAVRDKLLGIEPRDRDWVVVGATPEQMEELGYQPVGKDFPVQRRGQHGPHSHLAPMQVMRLTINRGHHVERVTEEVFPA